MKRFVQRGLKRAFTLLELMIVVSIMMLLLLVGTFVGELSGGDLDNALGTFVSTMQRAQQMAMTQRIAVYVRISSQVSIDKNGNATQCEELTILPTKFPPALYNGVPISVLPLDTLATDHISLDYAIRIDLPAGRGMTLTDGTTIYKGGIRMLGITRDMDDTREGSALPLPSTSSHYHSLIGEPKGVMSSAYAAAHPATYVQEYQALSGIPLAQDMNVECAAANKDHTDLDLVDETTFDYKPNGMLPTSAGGGNLDYQDNYPYVVFYPDGSCDFSKAASDTDTRDFFPFKFVDEKKVSETLTDLNGDGDINHLDLIQYIFTDCESASDTDRPVLEAQRIKEYAATVYLSKSTGWCRIVRPTKG